MSKFRDYIPQGLPVYREQSEGDRGAWNHKQCQCDAVGYDGIWKLVLVKDNDATLRVPTFHVRRDANAAAPIDSIRILSVDGSVDLPLSGWTTTIVNADSAPTKEIVIFSPHTYTDIQIPPSDTPALDDEKYFYLLIEDAENVWYTEVFVTRTGSAANEDFPCAIDGVCGYVHVGWVNSGCVIYDEDNVTLIYNNTPSFSMFLPVNVAQPTYRYSPQSREDGQGGFYRKFQRVDKEFGFLVVAPEYVADALAALQLMSSVTITFPNGDFVQAKNVTVEVTWDISDAGAASCLANINVRFDSAQTSLIRTGCC